MSEGKAILTVDGESGSLDAPAAPSPGPARVRVSQGWTLPTNVKFASRRIDVSLELPCQATLESANETAEACRAWTAARITEFLGFNPERQ